MKKYSISLFILPAFIFILRLYIGFINASSTFSSSTSDEKEETAFWTINSKDTRCGGKSHSNLTRPCRNQDTLCGKWSSKRSFRPFDCKYQDINFQEASKCLGNRTIAFIGDSQIRDMTMGLVYFLLGKYELDSAPNEKFDKNQKLNKRGELIPQIDHWNLSKEYGYYFPNNHTAYKRKYFWQIQYWSIYRLEALENHVVDILNNVPNRIHPKIHKIDLAFWQFGLHNLWWDKPPYGPAYYNLIAKNWLDIRGKVDVPSVWVSMNPQCEELLKQQRGPTPLQHLMVEEANKYMNRYSISRKLPYWDAGALLRVPERCNLSDDGVHVKMYVDIMRAKMLLNHLCDENMEWIGGIHSFL